MLSEEKQNEFMDKIEALVKEYGVLGLVGVVDFAESEEEDSEIGVFTFPECEPTCEAPDECVGGILLQAAEIMQEEAEELLGFGPDEDEKEDA